MSNFKEIGDISVKDTELRNGISTLRSGVLSQTIKPLNVTKNGTYTADVTQGTYGYSPVTVDVQEEPWQPLQDGYSNFWFELTEDTLSPWLNFSAKSNDAVIDWGDGSGEQTLDTLTPTHTYSKAGKYVVKVKGVTGIAQQYVAPYVYNEVLQYAELNNEVTSVVAYGFQYATGLKSIVGSAVENIGVTAFSGCSNLREIAFPVVEDASNYCFRYTHMLKSIAVPNSVTSIGTYWLSYAIRVKNLTIPSTVTSISNSAFSSCASLGEIHMLPTAPPTMGTNVFAGLPSNYIIYVPVGTGETYKAASGWSTYADHILEEGQTPNRAMLSNFENTKKSDDIEIENER